MKNKPTRIQLSRRRGFNLQLASRAINGLSAVNCARPAEWGNPTRVGGFITPAVAVEEFECYLRDMLKIDPAWLRPLRGRNLACWCAACQPCHADVLLKYANA